MRIHPPPRWPLDTPNLGMGSDSHLFLLRERKIGVISSELCSVPSPRQREIRVPQICTHMPGLKDMHKDQAEMIRKISFIALLLPRGPSFQRSPLLPPDVGLPPGPGWLLSLTKCRHTIQCSAQGHHPSFRERRNRSQTIKKLPRSRPTLLSIKLVEQARTSQEKALSGAIGSS